MSNNISKLNDAEMIALLTTMQDGLDGNLAAYGMTAAEFTAFETAAGNLNTSIISAETAEAAKRSAFAAKSTQRRATNTLTSSLAKRFYANLNITDAMLTKLGLAPRSTGGSRATPKLPLAFLASPKVTGEVTFSWKRNGNGHGVIFYIQQWINGTWTTVYATTKAKETLNGFAVGTEAKFRVYAWVNGQQSAASNESTIYPADDSGALTLAA